MKHFTMHNPLLRPYEVIILYCIGQFIKIFNIGTGSLLNMNATAMWVVEHLLGGGLTVLGGLVVKVGWRYLPESTKIKQYYNKLKYKKK